MNIPRLLIAAPKSGSGKTLLTCALLGALKKRNMDVIAYKSGPDYIDPMFHRTVQGIQCENIDVFFQGRGSVEGFLAETAQGRDIAVIEGAMGIFDGMGVESDEGSAYDTARLTKTPVVLVIDACGGGRSLLPLIKGFLDYDTEGLIKGVILNKIPDMFYGMIKPVIEKELQIPVVGSFPKREDLQLESRHLGLMLPGEISTLREKLEAASDQFLSTVDTEALLKIAREADEIEVEVDTGSCIRVGKGLTLGVARDEAFCFYYDANIRAFERMGVAVKEFSPLHDKKLPEGLDGILLGGGYPELYLEKLEENFSFRKDVKESIRSGMPSLAECGGFMYLNQCIKGKNGKLYEMAGVINGTVQNSGRLVRFGYVDIEEDTPCFLEPGQSIKAHEFHYYDAEDNGDTCTAVKPNKKRSWKCIHEGKDHCWGFPHLYYMSNPDFVVNFITAMKKYSGRKNQKV